MNSAPDRSGVAGVTVSSRPSRDTVAPAPSTVTVPTSKPSRSRLNEVRSWVAVARMVVVASNWSSPSMRTEVTTS